LREVLIQNFNTMDLVKFLEKNQKLHIQIIDWRWHYVEPCTKKEVKKSEKPRFCGQNKLLS
jgi:hypothetical protein